MLTTDLHSQWKEEYYAPFSGWDFSHLDGRWKSDFPPWDYRGTVVKLVKQSKALLDIGTGGGEFLASLSPLPAHTRATEGWQPNVAVARAKLEPLGVKVMETDETDILPFDDGEFDTVLNTHASFKETEVFRVLKPGGTYLTQQVGGLNLQDFAQAFETDVSSNFKKLTYDYWRQAIQNAGFQIIIDEEWRGPMEFMDVGAIAYYIKAVPWTAPGFDIDKNMRHLDELQRQLDAGEKLAFTQIRFLFQAQKPC